MAIKINSIKHALPFAQHRLIPDHVCHQSPFFLLLLRYSQSQRILRKKGFLKYLSGVEPIYRLTCNLLGVQRDYKASMHNESLSKCEVPERYCRQRKKLVIEQTLGDIKRLQSIRHVVSVMPMGICPGPCMIDKIGSDHVAKA